MRLGDETLDHRLGRLQQRGAGRQADQLEHAGTLVELRARLPQRRGLDRIDVGAGGGLDVLEGATQGLVGRFERLAQFFLDPGQGAQVVVGARGRAAVIHPAGFFRRCRLEAANRFS